MKKTGKIITSLAVFLFFGLIALASEIGDQKCPKCDGSGKFYNNFTGQYDNCYNCHGKGTIPENNSSSGSLLEPAQFPKTAEDVKCITCRGQKGAYVNGQWVNCPTCNGTGLRR